VGRQDGSEPDKQELARLRLRIAELESEAAEHSLAEQRFRTLVEHAPEAILVLDVESNRFVQANPKAASMFKCSIEELYRVELDTLHPEFQPNGERSSDAARRWVQMAVDGATPVFDWTHVDVEGNLIPCEVRLVRLASSVRVLVRGVMTDVTERKRLEEQLRQSQKMEAIGQLAGGVAHDFNNLLVAIMGHCDLLRLAMPHEPPLQGHVDAIRQAGQRAAELTRQLLAFGRKQVLRRRAVDLNQVACDVARLLERTIGENVELQLIPHPEPVVSVVDPGQMQQVLINLATNARDAMPRGGTLHIEVGRARLEDRAVGEVTAGPYATICITDEGVGMDAATIPRIFEPFFTTKCVGKGTGLGLSTVYGVIKQSGGEVAVESEPGRGSRFTLFLPLSASPPEPSQPRDLPFTAPASTGTILVVEDEAEVRHIVCRVLRDCGYEVLSASDGVQALEFASQATIGLLLTDVVMPRMGGVELAAILRERLPDLPVLFISGHADDAFGSAANVTQMEIMEKPFLPDELASRVRQMLERTS
jgi:two-component system, cell cycle sensor histidine kinase and response regulator CckA